MSFSEQFIGIIHNAVEDNSTDYIRELLHMLGGSSLEDYDDFNVQVWFKQMLEMSVVYTTLTRLGYDSKEYLDKADFSVVLDFNTPYTITQLGTATADMTDMVLRQVERTVYTIRRHERDTLAHKKDVLQNEVEINERRNSNGNHLPDERGLPASRDRNGSSTQGEHRQVREAQEEVFERESEGPLQLASSDEWTNRALGRDQSTGAGTDGSIEPTDGSQRERNRESGSTSMGRSRFCKNRISATTPVPALARNALFGRRMAPRRSARCAMYLRTDGFFLSIVPEDVIKATIPPGRTLSSVLAKK